MYNENDLVKLLTEKKYKITTAESCTGGLIAATIVNVSGASAVFDEGYITYANEAKIKLLGVSGETIEKYGVVSYETAYEMAKGAIEYANADCSIVSTGIAGPLGGTKKKPVGTVFVGIGIMDKVEVFEFHFDGDRESVRNLTVKNAISKAFELIKKM